MFGLTFWGSVGVTVPSSVRQDCLSLAEVGHNRSRLAAAMRRLTETDARSLRNISGLCRANPASAGPGRSSIREKTSGAAALWRSSIRNSLLASHRSTELEASRGVQPDRESRGIQWSSETWVFCPQQWKVKSVSAKDIKSCQTLQKMSTRAQQQATPTGSQYSPASDTVSIQL